MRKIDAYSKIEIENMVKRCTSFREFAKLLGYSQNSGSTTKLLKDALKEMNIDTSHFTGQTHHKNKGTHKYPIEKYLQNNTSVKSIYLKNRLIEEGLFEEKCCECGLTEWLGDKIPLELHHKDGNKKNNTLENLVILCPNCHARTKTYRGKNRKYKKVSKIISEDDWVGMLTKSKSIHEAIVGLGLNPNGGGNYERAEKIINKYNIKIGNKNHVR